jgi:L-ascorbate metabolism protein UlaG (beta-lactamase superfamily)
MRVDWFGQSAFRLSGQNGTVFIDPFGDMSSLADRGIQFDYPPITGVDADLVLVTRRCDRRRAARAALDRGPTRVPGG